MKRLLILSTILAIAAVGWLLVPSQNADALACIKCLPGGETSAVWGFGSTCSAATNDAISQASALVPGWCDNCGETVIDLAPCDASCSNTAACYDPYGEWRVDVKIRYRCREDLCLP